MAVAASRHSSSRSFHISDNNQICQTSFASHYNKCWCESDKWIGYRSFTPASSQPAASMLGWNRGIHKMGWSRVKHLPWKSNINQVGQKPLKLLRQPLDLLRPRTQRFLRSGPRSRKRQTSGKGNANNTAQDLAEQLMNHGHGRGLSCHGGTSGGDYIQSFFKSWPEGKTYLNKFRNQVTKEFEEWFHGHCYKCESHSAWDFRTYPEKSTMLSVSNCCGQG